MRRAGLIALVLLAWGWSTPAHATRTFMTGFDTCDVSSTSNEFAGNTTGTVGVTTTSLSHSGTNRCAGTVTVASGGNSYFERDLAPADLDTYARCKARSEAALTGTGRQLFANYQSATSTLGCRIDRETDGSLSLHFKDRTSYQELGRTAASQFSTSWRTLELHQSNVSGATCSGPCTVTCEVWLDGFRVMSTTLTSVLAADYGAVSNVRMGASDSATGAYGAAFDDCVFDDAARIGIGSVAPLYPESPDGSQTEWSNTCTGSHWNCLADFTVAAPAIDDGDANHQLSASNNNQEDVNLTSATQPSGGSIAAVRVFGVSRETGANSGAFRLNLVSSGTITGATSLNPPSTTYAIGANGQAFSATKPAGGAWTQGALDALQVQLDSTATGSIRITALLGYADLKEPDPVATQNNQDWDGDGRITYCFYGDSRIQGTGLGYCQSDASKTCSDNPDCAPPFTASDVGPCANTSKVATAFSGLATQQTSASHPTTILNCGIAGNITENLIQRASTMLSGVGQVTNRYCRQALFGMQAACTPNDSACSATSCTASACFLGNCDLNCNLVLGSKVCSNSHTTDCTANADCGAGTCTDLPGCDYVYPMIGINDLHANHNPECDSSAPLSAPCPQNAAPASSATPALTPAPTPTPGSYACRNTTCNNATECRTGRCTGAVWKACDTAGDCTGLGDCSTALAPPGDATCTSGICSCTCQAVPCATDADCGPGYYYDATGFQLALPQYGTCTAGHCTNCGPAGCPVAGTSYAHHLAWRAYRTALNRIALRTELGRLITVAGRRVIWLTDPPIYEPCTTAPSGWTANVGWGGALDGLLATRALFDLVQPNAVDLWHVLPYADDIIADRRCNTDVTKTCTANADCVGTGAQCVTYDSTLRPAIDPVHLGPRGASLTASAAYSYTTKLSPVCTSDPTTGCGRCSVTTGTACLDSDACPSGEKCVATDSVCTGASKGYCRAERACNSTSSCATHNLCTLTYARCTGDGDCAGGKDLCRTEGLVSPGEG